MRTKIFVGLMLAAAATAWAADKLHPLNVKYGLWEATITTKTTGLPPMMAEPAPGMSPEMKARMEESMKQMQQAMNGTQTSQHCWTKEKFDKEASLFEEKDNPAKRNCTRTVHTSTGDRMDFEEDCPSDKGRMHVASHFEKIDAEHAKGRVHMTQTGNGRTMEMTSDMAWKWIGASCGEVK
jgi:hypothetical protein